MPKEIDWVSKLQPNEIGEDDGVKFVYLKGLRRLAAEAGLVSEKHTIAPTTVFKNKDNKDVLFVQVQYTAKFDDGKEFSDCGDAFIYNTQDFMQVYLTCAASNRAQSRAIRRALLIDLVSKEELGATKDSPAALTNEITSAQVRVLKNLMKTKGITNQNEVIKNATDRSDVIDIEDLNFDEAKKAIKNLNSARIKQVN